MSITFDDLRKSLDLVLRTLEAHGEQCVKFDDSLYWSIPPEQQFNYSSKPTEMTLGDLLDDASELKKIVSGNDYPIVYSLSWLAAILRYLSVKNTLRSEENLGN